MWAVGRWVVFSAWNALENYQGYYLRFAPIAVGLKLAASYAPTVGEDKLRLTASALHSGLKKRYGKPFIS